MALAATATAALNEDNKPTNSWYSIKALSKATVEILLYDEIGNWGISAKQFARDLQAVGDVSQINLHIHSPGGDVFEGMAIYNLLVNHPARVSVFIDGLAASMASVIAMAGDTISIPENAMMMIHKPWGIQGGDADDMRRYAELLDKVEGSLVMSYVRKTGKTEDEIKSLLKEETWMTGREAVEAGFADQLTEPLAAAAQLSSQRMQEFNHMPEALKTLLQPRASVTPPAATPPAPAPVAAAPVAPAGESTAQIEARVLAAEAGRRDGIRAAFTPFATTQAALMDACINDMTMTVDAARTKLLAALGSGVQPSAPAPAAAHIHAGNGNLVGDSVRASVMARAGHAEIQNDNRYNHMSLKELARASLADRNIGVSTLHPMQMVALAFTHTSSDFGTILLDVANKSVLQGWEGAEETYQLWTKRGELSDFRVANRIGLGEFPSLRKVREGAEYKYVTVGESSQQIALATYGEIFSITRQAIINDDMNMLSDIPRKMGEAAKATIGDLVYAVLIANAALADGKALFHADHKNLLTGAGSALSVDALDKARTLMRTQKTAAESGAVRPLNIRPAFVLTPVGLESKALQLINSTSVPGADVNAGIVNPIQSFAKVISDARLDDASATAWYLAARQGADTIEVAYLNGVDTPYLEQQQGFTVDGVASKVRIDAGVAPLDFRGLTKANGA